MIKLQKYRTRKILRYLILIIGGVISSNESTYAKFDGFYVGGSLGYLQQNSSINAQQDPGDSRSDLHKSTANNGSPITELFFGWGKIFNNSYYGGLEGQIDFVVDRDKKIVEDTNFLYKINRNRSGLAALLRIGYLIHPLTMIYGGFGSKILQLKYDLSEKNCSLSAPFQKTQLHLLAETGLEVSSMSLRNFSLRLSYAYMFKRNAQIKSNGFPVNHIYFEKGSYIAGTSEHAIKIGLIYRF